MTLGAEWEIGLQQRDGKNYYPSLSLFGRSGGFPLTMFAQLASNNMSFDRTTRSLHIELHQLYMKARSLGVPASFRHAEENGTTTTTISIITPAPKKENLVPYKDQAVPGFASSPTSTTS